MCIICISKKGVRQPNTTELKTMFKNNPDGAGYMFLNSDNEVEIHKGFMTWEDFQEAIRIQKFTKDDVVIYHFRISTQAGVNPQMCHPFPLTDRLEQTEYLNCVTPVGIAHNGVIALTSDRNNKQYSDTALFITRYLVNLVKCPDDLEDKETLKTIEKLAGSKLAILDNWGRVTTIGNFINDKGLLFSNGSYKPERFTYSNVNYYPSWHAIYRQ